MMYLAPRQGLFAIIILVSFCLQTLLLVISTDQQLSKSRAQKGEQMVAQLIDEARLALENKDRVSLSVIANRYTSEQDVARIVIKDSNDELLVPVGNAPMQQGDTIRKMATKGDAVIGSVALTLKDISKGEIIAMQWPFVIGSLLLHLFLWLLYGYVARPTKEQINTLSHEIQDLHRDRYRQEGQNLYNRRAVSGSVDDTEAVEQKSADSSLVSTNTKDAKIKNDTKKGVSAASIHDELNAYLKSQQNPDANREQAVDVPNTAGSDSNVDQGSNTSTHAASEPNKTSKLSSARTFDHVSVQIMLHDEFNMLERLAPEMRAPYLALCTQLLNQAMNELLRLPLLLGVSAINEPHFDDKGAAIALLKADNSHAKVALAGVMLAKLYLMLNKIIHDKHIELARFALPAKAGVSDKVQLQAMTQLLESIGSKEQMLILLPNAGLKQIATHVKVKSVQRPTTVYERECTIFDGGNDALIQRLADVRNAVLMIDE
ncbi:MULTISPECIES: hypothetical protein [unclassified Psychrobacter]|uniref:hypothetical protein n=1 Tax=unclassified Psychrobacter TaxID=196806 RepID=UPI003FD08B10